MKSPSGVINVAIAGGGISGLCLARGLLQCPNLKVSVYEGTSKYLDIGGGLAFHGNAMRALELIDPELQAEYFRRATTISERDLEMATLVMIGDAEDADGNGKLLAELGKAKGRKTVARSDLLDGLLSLLPSEMVHFGKRLAKINETDEGVELTFRDGSTASADVLIGCDGIHSIARSYLLGADHPAVQLKNHDRWVLMRRMVPAEEVNALNPTLFDSVYILCGHGSYVNTMPIHMGKTLSVAVVAKGAARSALAHTASDIAEGKLGEPQQDDAENIDLSRFKHWSKNVRDMVELASREPDWAWKLADHDPAPIYARGRVCMAGDAAHATMPFSGQGAAQAIEDAAVLTAVFQQVTHKDQVEAALKAYEHARKERSQKVVEISRTFGRMYAFEEDEVGEDVGKLMRKFGEGAGYTNNVDLVAQNESAVRKFQELVA